MAGQERTGLREQTGGCGISGMGILQAGCNDASGKRKGDPGTGDRRIPDYQSEFHKMGNDPQLFLYPADKADEKRHKELLEAYGVSDTQAYMSQFYPEIKREIRESWKRLFDDDIQIGSDGCYGNIWEVRREWVKNVIQ